jgi:hypothetical protein
VVLKQPSDAAKLHAELNLHEQFIKDKEVMLRVDRKSELNWVAVFISELSKLGASTVLVKTETRHEFPGQLRFVPQRALNNPAPCSVVSMVLEDRGTAVWKLSGGVATKYSKGFAGPDLTMTADALKRFAKGCSESDLLFISAAQPIEWGLAYDLGASAYKLDPTHFGRLVLLDEVPTAGRKVELSSGSR